MDKSHAPSAVTLRKTYTAVRKQSSSLLYVGLHILFLQSRQCARLLYTTMNMTNRDGLIYQLTRPNYKKLIGTPLNNLNNVHFLQMTTEDSFSNCGVM